jgi:glycosyltransferase involved in cell wall biosynthesis
MDVSVILCTYNRCGSLASALASVAVSKFRSPAEWEVVIVDNNSKDQTRAVAEEYCHRYPGKFRYIFEGQQGKSNALNRGIRESKASILAFMDDDVVVEPDWLENVIAPLNDCTWTGVGGRIVPPIDFSPPRWLALDGPYSLGGILALFDRGPEGSELTEAPIGTNMAFRKEAFEKYGLFRPDLGPCPGTEIRGEDIEFGRRVLKGGSRFWYEPSAIVHHAVAENRIQKEYFLRFLYDNGRALIRGKEPAPPIWFIPRLYFAIPKIVVSSLLGRTVAWLFSTNVQQRFQRKCMVWMNAGQIFEILHIISRGGATANRQVPPLVIGTEERK